MTRYPLERAVRTCLLASLMVLLVSVSATGQAFPVSDHPDLRIDQLGQIDDIVCRPNGQILIAKPAEQTIGYLDFASPTPYAPLPLPPMTVLAMEIGPDGHLYICDSTSDSIRRYDFSDGSLTTVSTGYHIPIDIVFDGPDTMYICNLTTNDFHHGPLDLHRVDLVNGVEVSNTILVSGILGAADVAVGPGGILYITALGAMTVGTFDQATGQVGTVGTGIFLAADIIMSDADHVLVSALYKGTLYEVDLRTGDVTTIVSNLGSTQWGAEDMAYTAQGNVLVTVRTGEVYEIDLSSALRQVGNASLGDQFHLRINAPSHPGFRYSIGLSLSADFGFQLPGTTTVYPIDLDSFFFATAPPNRPSGLLAFDGFLDASGSAVATAGVIDNPVFEGFQVYASALLYPTPTSPFSTWDVTNAIRITLVR